MNVFFSWFWRNSRPSAKIWIAQKNCWCHISSETFSFFGAFLFIPVPMLLLDQFQHIINIWFFFCFFFLFCKMFAFYFSLEFLLENWFDEAYEHRLLVGSCVETNRFGHLNSRCQKKNLIFGWCFKNILVPEFFQHAALYKAMNKSLLKL